MDVETESEDGEGIEIEQHIVEYDNPEVIAQVMPLNVGRIRSVVDQNCLLLAFQIASVSVSQNDIHYMFEITYSPLISQHFYRHLAIEGHESSATEFLFS